MKRIALSLIALSLISVACSSTETKSDTDQLSELRSERDSLITLKDEMNARLLIVDEEIAKLDTTKRLNLVTSIEVSRDTFEHYFAVLAEVNAEKNVLMYSEIQGVIQSIAVTEGQAVKKGDLLLSIDADIIESNIQELKSQLELATTIYNKRQKLWDQQIGSEVEYLQAKNNKESLESRLKAVTAQYELSQIRAPFSGIVDNLPAKVGEMAAPGLPLLRIISLDEVYLKGDVSERYLKKVATGTHVDVEFESIGLRVPAQISQVGNFIKPENRTFQVRVDLKNPKNQLKPNLLANMLIRDYQKLDAITLPNRVIQQSPDGRSFVYLFEAKNGKKGQITRRFITTGVSYGERTEIISGLNGGENVVDKGARSVKDGQRVELSA